MVYSESDGSAIYRIDDFGAVGDGTTLCTEAIQEAIDTCHEAGGGTVVVPPGTYVTGTIYLKSHITLHLLAGATLRGSTNPEDYNADDIFPENPVFSTEDVSGAHLVIAYRADDVAIVGDGTIDGNSSAFFEALPPGEVTDDYQSMAPKFTVKSWRPAQMVFFCRCTNVRVRDISLINAPYWTLFLLACTGVQIRGLRITNPPQTRNGDGLDIDCCRDVTVSDSIIHSGDDSLTLRGYSTLLGDDEQACENVTVSNCVLCSATCGVRVGVGNGTVMNCTLSNIVIKETRTGINMISAYSAKHDGVTIENIRFSNMIMDTIVPINVLLGETARPPADIRDISFSHIRATGHEGAYIGGNEEHPVSGLRLHDVELRMTGGEVDADFSERTPRPVGTNRVPAGIFLRHVDDVRMSGLRIRWDEIAGGWQHAVVVEDSSNLSIAGLEASVPPTAPDGEIVHQTGVTDMQIHTE
ncbi:MAG: glycosyl hydrolase family 28 protein [Armatimonadota bacterium]